MHGVDFPPAPVEHIKGFLVFRGELRAVAKGGAGGRSGADVQRRRQVVIVELGILACAVAPAIFAATDDVIDACGAIPRRVEVILHVGVVGKEFAIAIHAAVEDVAEAAGKDFHVLPLGIEAVNDAARSHDVAVVAATIGHASEEMIIAPKLRDGRRSRRSGDGAFFEHGVVAGDEVEAFAIGRLQNGMHAVIAAGVEFTQHLDLVRNLVAVAVGDAIEAAGDFFLVVVHADIERTEGKEHAVHATDVGGQLLHVSGLQRLAFGRRGEAIEAAVLIAGVDASFFVAAKIHPGTLLTAGDAIKQLHFEIGQSFDVRDRRGHIRADGWSDRVGALGLVVRFWLCFGFRMGVGLAFRGLRRLTLGFRCGPLFLNDLGVARDRGFLKRHHSALRQFFEHHVFDLHLHCRATMDLEGEQALQRTLRQLEVEQVDGHLAVNLVDQVIAPRDDGVFMPLGDIHLHRLMLADEPALRFGIGHHALAILHDDAATAFLIDHRIVRMRGMDVALIAANGPLAIFWQFLAAILNACVVAYLFDLGFQLEVLHHATAPDEKLIIGELLWPSRGAHDLSVLHLPQLGIPIPASEVFAVEQRLETILGEGRR